MSEADFAEPWFDTAPCGLLAVGADGRILAANPRLAEWTGIAAADLVGRPFAGLLPPGGRLLFEAQLGPRLLLSGRLDEVALELSCADGGTVPVLANAVIRRDADGRAIATLFAMFVARQRRSYEHGLLAARDRAEATVVTERETAELREQFIAVLGHDLRNPLGAIGSGVRLLDKESLSPRGRQILALMDGSVVRAAGLIDNVLDFARARLGGGIALDRDARASLEPVLRQVVAELRALAPEREVDEDYVLEAPVDCDRARIGQLLSNLLGNALTHGMTAAPVRVAASTSGGRFTLSVTNEGPPIAPEAAARLFQPFYRQEGGRRREGLGLGLNIAAEIARAHGGTLTVASAGGNIVFTFTMALAAPH